VAWHNWSGNVTAEPQQIVSPSSESELSEIVRRAVKDQQTIRIVGTGHSFVPLCATDGLLLSLDNLQGVVALDETRGVGTIWAGSKLHQLGEPLLDAGLALHNMGDIDRQSLAGAIGTGTHGTGPTLGNLSTQVVGLHIITATGDIVEISTANDPERIHAARVSLGALGIVSRVTLRLLPAYRLHERTWVEPFDECFGRLDELIAATRHFEFFWSPPDDACACKALHPTEMESHELKGKREAVQGRLERYVQEARIDFSHRIFPSERNRLFNEMEYAVPEAAGPACMQDIRRLMLERFPDVTWPVEYRTLGGDETWLSPAYQRDAVTISIHQAAELPYNEFFAAAEEVFRAYEGRPHWGKLHAQSPAELAALYPRWEAFQKVRQALDPQGCFLNDYLREIFAVNP